LIHQDIYDFTNTTLAELDLRVYNAPQNETFAKMNINQVNDIGKMNTTNQVIIGHYKNATNTLAELPALKIINYYFGNVGQKEMQVWTEQAPFSGADISCRSFKISSIPTDNREDDQFCRDRTLKTSK
jgi:hypothetical protein